MAREVSGMSSYEKYCKTMSQDYQNTGGQKEYWNGNLQGKGEKGDKAINGKHSLGKH